MFLYDSYFGSSRISLSRDIFMQVFDKKSSKSIGELTVPLKSLLSAPDMTLDQNFNLKNSGPNSKINMRLCLRVKPSAIHYYLFFVLFNIVISI